MYLSAYVCTHLQHVHRIWRASPFSPKKDWRLSCDFPSRSHVYDYIVLYIQIIFVGRYDYVAFQCVWHTPVCMYIHMYIHVCIHCNAYTRVCVRMRACVRADVRVCEQVCVRACKRASVRACMNCMYTFRVHHLCLISHQSHNFLVCLKATWRLHCTISSSVGKKGQDVCRVKQCLYLLHLFRRSSSKRASIFVCSICCAYNGCLLLEFHYAGNSHICIYIYKFIYISIYINAYISIWVYLCTWIHLYVWIHIYEYKYIWIYEYIYIYRSLYIYIHVCIYIYMYTYINVLIYIYMCVYIYIHMFLYIYIYIYIYI